MTGQSMSEFAFVKLVVRDLDAMAAFYRAVCGYGVVQRHEAVIGGRAVEEIVFMKPGGGIDLALLAYVNGPASLPSGVIVAFSTPDLDAFQARVIASGGMAMEPIRDLEFGGGHVRIGFFADIEGYLLEVFEVGGASAAASA